MLAAASDATAVADMRHRSVAASDVPLGALI